MQVVEGESFSAALYPNNCLDLMQHFCSQVSLDVGDDFWASSRNHVIQISPSGLWLCLHESRIIYFYVICSSLMLLNLFQATSINHDKCSSKASRSDSLNLPSLIYSLSYNTHETPSKHLDQIYRN